MSDDRERPKDAGETMREGVRSIAGILGALKEAIEETFEDLRPGAPTNGEAADEARSAFQRAQETVEEMRDRFDFVPRREFDALRATVEDLKVRLEALSGTAASAPAGSTGDPDPEPTATAGGSADANAGKDAGPDPAGGASRFRFETE